MSYIEKPHGTLLALGIVFLVIGFCSLSKSLSPPPIPNCEGAKSYRLSKDLPEVVIEVRPDCWSGAFDSEDGGLSYDTLDSNVPYDALFSDSYIHEGHRVVGGGKEIVRHPLPVRFKGTGKMKISLYGYSSR
jgi:hypothetical protein